MRPELHPARRETLLNPSPFDQTSLTRSARFSRAVPVLDPGVDGLPGAADDGPAIVVHDLPEAGVSPSYRVANVPNAPNDHVTWEATRSRQPN